MVYLPFEDEYRSADQVSPGTQSISLSGTDIRRRVREGAGSRVGHLPE
jgi:sulfate adenylyltransferase